MCPSAPLSQPQAIDNQADDTEIFMHLRSMMQGAPSPENVLSDVDPCKYVPWNLPSNFLYFLNSDDAISLKAEKGITTTEKGYWQVAGTLTRSPNTGTITELEFYRGQAPYGDKTVWVMYKYTIDSKSLGSSSVCKVFSRSDPSHTKEHRLVVTDNQQPILQSLEEGETNRNLHISSNISPVLSRNLRPDISRGDYSVGASSSSHSENSCMALWNMEECFDQEAFLHELETPGTPDTNPEYFDSGTLLRYLETPAATDGNPEYFDAGALLRNLETPAVTDDNPEYFDAGALLRSLETPGATDANPEYFDAGALLQS